MISLSEARANFGLQNITQYRYGARRSSNRTLIQPLARAVVVITSGVETRSMKIIEQEPLSIH